MPDNIQLPTDGTGKNVRTTELGGVHYQHYLNGAGSTGTLSSPAITTTASTIVAAGPKLGVTITNEGAGTVYIALGATASATNYTVALTTGAYYEVPFNFLGSISAIGSAAATLRVTVIT